MKLSTRWQDLVALAAGAVMVLTPLWSDPGGAATTAMLVLGLVLGLTALWSMADPGEVASEWMHAVIGVMCFLAPFLFDYTGETVAAYTSYAVGIIAFAAGLMVVRETGHLGKPVAH